MSSKDSIKGISVLLVQPNTKESPTGLPIGLCQLSAVLKKKGYIINGLDLMIDSEELFNNKVKDVDILGITVTTRTLSESIRIASNAKKINPSIKVIAGGPHSTLLPTDIINNKCFDYCVVGEGEYTIVELIEAIEGKRSIENVKGIWYREGNTLHQNKGREFEKNLDLFPFPDRDLFDINKYGRKNWYATPIMASRSCPNNCSNCVPALHIISGKYRKRSVKNVIVEMKMLYSKYSIKYFFFQDNTISINKRWFMELMNAIKNIPFFKKIKWSCTVTMNTLNREVLELMKESGCFKFYVGVESGSQEVLDNILNKKVSLEHTKEILRIADDIGLEYHLFFMIGIPGETKEQMLETVEFAKHSNANTILFNVGKVIPCIGWEETVKRKNWLLSDSYDISESQSLIKTDKWNPEFVENIRQKIQKDFNKMKWKIDGDSLYNLPKNSRMNFKVAFGGELLRFLKKPTYYSIRNIFIIISHKFKGREIK